MRILGTALTALLLMLTSPALAQTAPRISGQSVLDVFDAARWQSPQQRDGLTTYMRPSRVPSAVETLVVMRIRTPQEAVVTALTDVDAFCEWVANCMSTRLLDRQGPDRFSYVMRIAFPPPFTDRFSVVEGTVHRFNDSDIFLLGVPDPRYRDYALAGSRRMVRADGAYRVRRIDAQTTELSAYFAINPGGGIPLWATAAFSRQNTAATARLLRTRLER